MQIKTYKPESQNIKALLYGNPGVGKTYFIGSAPEVLIISAEAGLLGIPRGTNYVEVKSTSDLMAVYEELKKGNLPYKTIALDSITEINEIIKNEIEAKNGASMRINDWGDLSKKVNKIFRMFRDLPYNIIFSALEGSLIDGDKIVKYIPLLNGKTASFSAGFFDIVGHMYIDEKGQRIIDVENKHTNICKSRGNYITNETPNNFGAWMEIFSNIEIGEGEVIANIESEQSKTETIALDPTIYDELIQKYGLQQFTEKIVKIIEKIESLPQGKERNTEVDKIINFAVLKNAFGESTDNFIELLKILK